jgi:NAD(P)-dependent dehydrogenase (short-subunit alcohol dehydrogenase family)
LYAQSKLANVLYAAQLARQYPKIKTVAIHPGVIMTGIVTGLDPFGQFIIRSSSIGLLHLNESQGCYNTLWAATSVDMVEKPIVSGECYQPVGLPVKHTKQSSCETAAKQLWNWTESELANFA